MPHEFAGDLRYECHTMLLNFLNAEVDGDQLFSEICDLNEVLSFINGELEPNI